MEENLEEIVEKENQKQVNVQENSALLDKVRYTIQTKCHEWKLLKR
jgi:hypothetical protein